MEEEDIPLFTPLIFHSDDNVIAIKFGMGISLANMFIGVDF